MMTQVTSRSLENSLVQEAIFAASVEVMQAMSYRWDYNSAENNTAWELSRVLNIAGDCNAIPVSNRYGKRPGHIERSCYSNLNDLRAAVAANLADANITNLDNANTLSGTATFTGTDSSGYGYKKAYTKETTVNVTDFSTSNIGNIKNVVTTFTAPDNANMQVVLEAFSANIGEVELLKRNF